LSKCLKCGASLPPVGDCTACATTVRDTPVPSLLDRDIRIDRRSGERPSEPAFVEAAHAPPSVSPLAAPLPAPRAAAPQPGHPGVAAPRMPSPQPGVAAPRPPQAAAPRATPVPGVAPVQPRATPVPGVAPVQPSMASAQPPAPGAAPRAAPVPPPVAPAQARVQPPAPGAAAPRAAPVPPPAAPVAPRTAQPPVGSPMTPAYGTPSAGAPRAQAPGLPRMGAAPETAAAPAPSGLPRMGAAPEMAAAPAPSGLPRMGAAPEMAAAPAPSGLPRMETPAHASSGLPRMEPAHASSELPPLESPAHASSGLPPMEPLPASPAATANIGIARSEAIRAPVSAARTAQPAANTGEVHARPASLWRRLLSFTIDTAAIAGVAALYITLASSVTGLKAPDAGLTGLDAFVGWLRALHTVLVPGFFLVLVLALVYCAVAAFLWNGRTLGRLLLGLRLVDTRGQAPAPGRAIVRAVLASLSFGLFLGGFWMALFDRRGQTLHDKLTSTFVVQPS
jgi:uncharacterized RDD family membrane protein YckC